MDEPIRRRDDGSIDYPYYKALARDLRRAESERVMRTGFLGLWRLIRWRRASRREIASSVAAPAE